MGHVDDAEGLIVPINQGNHKVRPLLTGSNSLLLAATMVEPLRGCQCCRTFVEWGLQMPIDSVRGGLFLFPLHSIALTHTFM